MSLKAIILAAGKGTRMKSDLLKVAHEIAGKPIVSYVIDTVKKCGVHTIHMVVGHQSAQLKDLLSNYSNLNYVTQEQQLGTGHAVLQAKEEFDASDTGNVLILAGDCPLIKEDTLKNLIAEHQKTNCAGTVLSTRMDDPAAYGRISRDNKGALGAIVEAKDCSDEQLKIDEINTGVYIFNTRKLFHHLSSLSTDNSQGEYYLTDIIQMLKDDGELVSAYCTDDPDQAIGINTRMDIAKTNQVLYQRNNMSLMRDGVTILDPNTTFIDSVVKIGHDTVIHPFTRITGKTSIGTHCEVFSHCFINDSEISDNEKVLSFSRIDNNH
jgi:bifunctional UDP-N-acetylglucosamine pyrophosphorylase / glucosamine-1-phosphate N-acetyltransferase